MNLLLHNATLVDPFGPIGVVDKGYVLIEDDLIKAVGEGDAPEKGEDHMDLHGALLMPALINTHTHLYSALALGMPGPSAPPVTFQETLENIWWKLDRALDKESTRASFRVGLAESLRAGTGTVIDHHSSQNWVEGSLEILAEAAGEIGARIGVAFEITDRNGSEVMEQELKETEWALRTCAGDPFVRPMIGLHASFTLEDSTLERVAELKKQYPHLASIFTSPKVGGWGRREETWLQITAATAGLLRSARSGEPADPRRLLWWRRPCATPRAWIDARPQSHIEREQPSWFARP